jgi:hypothetical protein
MHLVSKLPEGFLLQARFVLLLQTGEGLDGCSQLCSVQYPQAQAQPGPRAACPTSIDVYSLDQLTAVVTCGGCQS